MFQARCYECGGKHKFRSDKFPKQLTTMISVVDKPEQKIVTLDNGKETETVVPATYTLKRVVVGYVCAKCVGKVNLAQLKKHIREANKMDAKAVVTKHHIRDFFKTQETKGLTIPKEDKNAKKRIDQKAGRTESQHPELLHNQQQARSTTLLGKALDRFFKSKNRKGE